MSTGIQWTDETWNPASGCSKVSQGCKHCYAERVFPRAYSRDRVDMPHSPGAEEWPVRARKFTDVVMHRDRLDQPLRWKRPRRIFVNSMSDLFHEDVPFEFIAAVFSIMAVTTRHKFQVLTKRPARMLEFFRWALQYQEDDGTWSPVGVDDFHAGSRISEHWPPEIPWSGYDNCGPAFPYENVWLGVSVEDQQTADERIPLLLQTPAAVRFISAEPLLGPIVLGANLPGYCPEHGYSFGSCGYSYSTVAPHLDWVIVGGESGPYARECDIEWVRWLVKQCKSAGVPVFVKQLGARATGWCFGNCDSDGNDCSTTGFSSTAIGCQSFEASEGAECPDGRCCMRRDRKGADPIEWPAGLRVREFPA